MNDSSTGPGPGCGAEEYPRIVKGQVAEVYGLRVFVDQGWMTLHFAAKLTGVRGVTLTRWAEAGLVSFRQDEPGAPFRFLRAELLVVTDMRTPEGSLTIKTIRRHVTQKVEVGV